MCNNGGGEREKKSNVGVRRRASEFSAEGRERRWHFKKTDFLFPIFFSHKALATCPILSGAKRGPPLPLDVTSYSATRREKILPFEC